MRTTLRIGARLAALVALYLVVLFVAQALETRSLHAAYGERLAELRRAGVLADSLTVEPPARLGRPVDALVALSTDVEGGTRGVLSFRVAEAARELRADPWWHEVRAGRALLVGRIDARVAEEVARTLRAGLDGLEGEALAERLALWLEWVQTMRLARPSPRRRFVEDAWLVVTAEALELEQVSAAELIDAHEEAFRWAQGPGYSRSAKLTEWATRVDDDGWPNRAARWQIFARGAELTRALELLDEIESARSMPGSLAELRKRTRQSQALIQSCAELEARGDTHERLTLVEELIELSKKPYEASARQRLELAALPALPRASTER